MQLFPLQSPQCLIRQEPGQCWDTNRCFHWKKRELRFRQPFNFFNTLCLLGRYLGRSRVNPCRLLANQQISLVEFTDRVICESLQDVGPKEVNRGVLHAQGGGKCPCLHGAADALFSCHREGPRAIYSCPKPSVSSIANSSFSFSCS